MGSVLVVVGINAYTNWKFYHGNGFLRKLPSNKIVGTGFLKIDGKSVYFAGKDSSHIYLGSIIRLNRLLKVNPVDKDTAVLHASGFDTLRLHAGSCWRINNNSAAIFDGLYPVILSGAVKDFKLTQLVQPQYFTDAVPVPGIGYLLETNKGGKNSLSLYDSKSMSKPFQLGEPSDNTFSTDGMLVSTPDGSRFFYVYYYKNSWLNLNSVLKLVYRGKTIDTVAHQIIKVDTIRSNHSITIASPPVYVSKHADARNDYLFIQSGLKAENEIETNFKHIAVIDVYSVKNGVYQFSFYLPDFDGEKLRDFRVLNDRLLALYDHYLYFFQLRF